MTIAPHVLHLTRTACLLESRAYLYSGYLASVFRARGPKWVETFERWGAEEETHGQALRDWLAVEDPGFDFERLMADYLRRVPYPVEVEESVYGSHQAELREALSAWLVKYHTRRAHQSLGWMTPSEYRAAHLSKPVAQAA